jgi:hypothetical protein
MVFLQKGVEASVERTWHTEVEPDLNEGVSGKDLYK